MRDERHPKLPQGVQPYDRLNGLRIGALTGGVIALFPAIFLGGAPFWLVGGALVGGLGGYVWDRRSHPRS